MEEGKSLLDDMCMEDLLRELPPERDSGETVRSARVIGIVPEGVFVDVGLKSEGLIPREELSEEELKELRPGQNVPVVIRRWGSAEGHAVVSWRQARERQAWERVGEAHRTGAALEGRVSRRVKGGLMVNVGLEAFLPGSQIDRRPVKDIDRWVGQAVKVLVTEVDRGRGNVVVSRRKFVDQEFQLKREVTLASLKQGEVRQGEVTGITSFGAFVDLGGVEGLLHIGDIAWQRTARVDKVLSVGQTIQVKVLKHDPATGRVSLGLKQLTTHPWEGIAARYPVGSQASGRVTTLTNFGAFVEIEPGVEGLIHVSELSWKQRVNHPQAILSAGQTVTVRVLHVDPAKEKLSLSLKRIGPNPWEEVHRNHPIGSRVRGPITHLPSFGAFMMLPEGVEGLIHVSDLFWSRRVRTPSEVLSVGQEVEAVVLEVNAESEKIALSLKHLTDDPLLKYETGAVVTGQVARVGEGGVVVALESDVEGVIPMREIGRGAAGSRRGGTKKGVPVKTEPEEGLKVGDAVTAKVLRVDHRERRLELSLKRYEREQERAMVAQYTTPPAPLSLKELLGEPEA
ncbi:MAG: 30S ribosomal protein S1 [Elusimicrobia bacterium]|nr:30S ribosomal protein S1 [Elusimicrobiota bacterium]